MATRYDPDLILAWLDDRLWPKAVLLHAPLRLKHPVFDHWQRTSFEDTLAPEYQAALREAIARGGNLGVRLGIGSGVAIDFDTEEDFARFLDQNPRLRSTFTTRGVRGAQIWIQPTGPYPRKTCYSGKKSGGKPG